MCIKFVHVKCIFTADYKEGGKNLCPTGFATAAASVCTNSWQHYCSSYMYSVNLFVAENYEHMNIVSSVCVFVILDRTTTTHTLRKILHRWVECVYGYLCRPSPPPSIALCTTICWTTQRPIPKEFSLIPQSLSLHPSEFYGLQQKHNFIEANFIGKYGDEQRCKSSTNYIIVAVMYRILDALRFECHWISSGPYFGVVNT